MVQTTLLVVAFLVAFFARMSPAVELRAKLTRLSPGMVLDRYELLEPVGRGAMGEVWRARHTVTDALCAIKVLHPHLADQEKKAQLFVREAQVGARLNQHPNIVRVQDAGRDPRTGMVFLVMELLEGETLEDCRLRQGPLPPELARLLFAQLGSAVQTAHDAGIVHRDLKPGNLFLSRDHEGAPLLKVLDFGIARVLEGGATRTATHIGTPAYAAPEQLGPTFRAIASELGVAIAEDVSSASDVWSLGLTAYDLLTGVEPGSFWGVEADAELPLKIALEPAPLPSTRAGDAAAFLPSGFDEWFARCVDRDATRRWASFREAALALVALCEPHGAEATGEPARAVEPSVPPPDTEGRARLLGSERPQALTPSVRPLARLPSVRPSERPGESELAGNVAFARESEAARPAEPAGTGGGGEAAPEESAEALPHESTEGETPPTLGERRARRVRRLVWTGLVVFLGSMLVALFFTQLWLSSSARLTIVVSGPLGAAVDPVEISVATESGRLERSCSRSPCMLVDLKPATYLVSVKAAGYLAAEPRAVLLGHGANQVDVELSPAVAETALRISAPPGGAFHLTIDGRDRGGLPATVNDLSPGEHLVHITDQRGLYQPFEKRMRLSSGQRATLEAKPAVARGMLSIVSGTDAEGARVMLVSGDERRLLPTLPMTVELMPDRDYQLVATKAGFEDFETKVSFRDGEAEKALSIAMVRPGQAAASANATPLEATPGLHRAQARALPVPVPTASATTGTININSLPPSLVTVDGQPYGETPKRWTGPPGMHTIRFFHPQYETKVQTVEVKAGATTLATARFP